MVIENGAAAAPPAQAAGDYRRQEGIVGLYEEEAI